MHTIAWFRHPKAGPMYFHGAPQGQPALPGFRSGAGTALATVRTRRLRAHDPFVATAYVPLAEDRPGRSGAGVCRAGAGQP
ncbi:hypothetical protein AB0937_36600 [Streptomyces sp. NPDC047880]|uniref:hypothetical protein n=1 Tax=Streptomyces sp. NPDC047880 TaxID=3155626 RepID=UPI0034550973